MKTWLRGFSVVVGLSLVAGCGDQLTSVTGVVAPANARLNANGNAGNGSPFNPVSKKYSDNGAKPATGRSGSASIQARALLGATGNTTIEVSTGQLDTQTAPGTIAKVQLKAINGAGDVIKTTNFNGLAGGGYWSHETDQLGHNAPIQVQTNVRGIDPKRTDVVTVKATVKKRPDIAVQSITNPARVHVNQAVNITALLSEINGDVGATGACILYINGAQADQVPVVWIDAGSSVTCQFSATFATAGDYALKAAFTGVTPGDWSLVNNEASGTIKAVLPVIDLAWSAQAYSNRNTQQETQNYSYNDCYYYYYSCYAYSHQRLSNWTNQNSSLHFYASTHEAGAASPMDVSFSMTSNATIGGMDAHGLDVGNGCAFIYDADTGTQGWICASGNRTSAQFHKNGGASTYYSQTWWNSYSRYTSYYWSRYVCGYSWGRPYYCYYRVYYTAESYNSGYYTNNGTSEHGAPFFELGSSVATSLNITDANGLQFKAGGTFAVSESPYNYSWNNCSSYGYYYHYQDCRTGSTQGVQKNAYGWGYGVSGP